jgi:MFS family permease
MRVTSIDSLVCYYLYRATSHPGFILPIRFVFLRSQGLSFVTIGLLEALYLFVVLLAEFPTGYLSDRLGRRNSLLIGTVLIALAMGGFGLAASVPAFAVTYLLWAIGKAFQSGSRDAWLYDHLNERDDAETFTTIHGRGTACRTGAIGLTSIVGGVLGGIDLYYPFIATLCLLTLNFLILLALPPNAHYRSTTRSHRPTLRQTTAIIRETIPRPSVRYLVCYIALFFAVIESVEMFIQPISLRLGVQVSQLGVLYAGFYFVSAVFAYKIDLISDTLGRRGWIALIPVVCGGLYIGAWFFHPLALVAFLITDASVRIMRSFVGQYINDQVSSLGRTSLLSTTSVIYSVTQLPFTVTAGAVAATHTLFTTLALLGSILLVGAVFIHLSPITLIQDTPQPDP